jgi:hypothetical protein
MKILFILVGSLLLFILSIAYVSDYQELDSLSNATFDSEFIYDFKINVCLLSKWRNGQMFNFAFRATSDSIRVRNVLDSLLKSSDSILVAVAKVGLSKIPNLRDGLIALPDSVFSNLQFNVSKSYVVKSRS